MKRFFALVFGGLLAFVVTAVAVGYPPATLTSTQNSITVGSLDCGTNYEIRVREQNGGAWTNSNTYTKTTLACTPTPTPTATPTPPPAPVANFSIDPNPAQRTVTTTFTSTGTCPSTPCVYHWFHGDATSTDEIDPAATQPNTDATYTYTGPVGTRTITLKVTDSLSRTSTKTITFDLVEPSNPTPTPTPTATPTGTPTATPTATPTPPPSGSFPTPSTTGVPAGTTLTAYTGANPIRTAGTVVDGKTMGCVRVEAANVTIRNSRITCPGGWAVNCDDSGDNYCANGFLRVEDSEISCSNTIGSNGYVGSHAVLVRDYIHGCENGGSFDRSVTIQDSYIQAYFAGDAHTDGIQLACPVSDVTISHNTIISTDTSDIISPTVSNCPPGASNILIQNNWLTMNGGAYDLYCAQGGPGVNYRVLNNEFTITGGANYSTECADETQSGNIDHSTRAPLSLD